MTELLRYIDLFLRCLLASTFAVALLSKVVKRRNASEFAQAVEIFGGFKSTAAARSAAFAVVLLESATVGLLALQGTAKFGYSLAAVLLTTFTGTLVLSMRRGVHAPCRCFGNISSEARLPSVVRNVLLLSGALTGLATTLLHDLYTGRLEAAGTVLALTTGLTIAALLIFADDLFAVFRPPEWDRPHNQGALR